MPHPGREGLKQEQAMPPAAAYGTLDSDGGCLAVDHREDHPELSSVFWEPDLTDNHSEYGTITH